MYYYVAPQCPEHLFFEKDRDERKARFNAAEKLAFLTNGSSLKAKMPHGFSTKSFVKITKSDLMPKNEEKISDAVKTLSKLSTAKRKAQKLNEQSQQSYDQVNFLFEDRFLTEEEYEGIEKSLKIIGEYAKAVSAYKEALPESQQAKDFLAEALKFPEQELKVNER
jgi:hypothetical protein